MNDFKPGDIVVIYTGKLKQHVVGLGTVVTTPNHAQGFECYRILVDGYSVPTRIHPSRMELSPVNDSPLIKALS